MTYSEKLKDPRWQKKRLEVMQRDHFTCTLCKAKDETLHVHHSVYEKGREPWDYPDSVLQTQCHFCHSIVEFLKKNDPESMVCEIKRCNTYKDGSVGFYVIIFDENMKAGLYVLRHFSAKEITILAFVVHQVISIVHELNESLKKVF